MPVALGRRQLCALYALFLLSGFSGLVYESIWTHYLKLFLGHAAYAQTLVLAIFMGGMAVGAALAARFSAGVTGLLALYGAVEILIGFQGLLFHRVYVAATDMAFSHWLPALEADWQIQSVKWGLSAALILPQSVLLGATFPLMSAAVIRWQRMSTGRVLANLYSTNSLGAAVGVLASGFWLIGLVGLPGTVMAAGIINVLLGVLAVLLARRLPVVNVTPNASVMAPISITPVEEKNRVQTSMQYWLLATALLTGLSSFVYEIIWIRMLGVLLGASTHAFELMLSAFILGLAIGGYAIRQYIDRLSKPVVTLAIIQVVMGLAVVSTLLCYNLYFEWMAWVVQHVAANDSGYWQFMLASHGFALMMMLPATICAGMTLPLVTHSILRAVQDEKYIGHVYACNTFGAILGVILAVHVLLPVLGLQHGLLLACAVDVLLGAGLFYISREPGTTLPWSSRGLVLSGVVAIVLVACVFRINLGYVSSGVFRHGQLPVKDILFHQDGKTASVDVVQADHRLSLITNGKPDAAIHDPQQSPLGDEYTMALLAMIPLSAVESPAHAAVIGMGSGITTHTLLADQSLQSVETIEIEQAIIRGAQFFGERSARAFTDPRSHVHIEDAKTYFTRAGQQYDLIISEPSNPWVSGVSSLFTQEFYRHVSHYLSAKGVFAQWLHMYEINDTLIASILNALGKTFPDYTVYQLNDTDFLVLASNAPVMPPLVRDVFADHPDMQREGARIGVSKLDDLRLRYLGNRTLLEPIYAGWTTASNSDFFPLLDQHALKARFLHTFSHSMIQWSPMRFFAGADESVPSPTPFPASSSNQHVMKVAQARAVAAWLMSGQLGVAPPSIGLADDVALHSQILTLFANGITECQLSSPLWQRSAQWVAYNVLLSLGREESAALWASMERQLPCTVQHAPGYPFWRLMQAVSQRDFNAIPELANAVLSTPGMEPSVSRFVAFLQALALVKEGHYAAAVEVIGMRFGRELSHNERSLLNLGLYTPQ